MIQGSGLQLDIDGIGVIPASTFPLGRPAHLAKSAPRARHNSYSCCATLYRTRHDLSCTPNTTAIHCAQQQLTKKSTVGHCGESGNG